MSRRALWARLAGLLICSLSLSSCLGSNRLPEEPAARKLQACGADQPLERKAAGASWQLRYLGPAAPLATAKAPWGSTLRYVIPYTRHTELYELSVTNGSQQVLWVDTAGLALTGSEDAKPLGLDFFERAWPAGAIRSEAELIDRSMALGEVVRTLFVRRPLQPGESYTGILPFRRSETAPTGLKLEGWQLGEQPLASEFCLSWASGS